MNGTLWTEPGSPRLWRAWNISGDELLNADANFSDEVLARIAGEGFTGIWLFCLLYDLMESRVFPELNRENAGARIVALNNLIKRAQHHGIGVYLYFNEPVGLMAEHPFWLDHPELKGAAKWNHHALCTSTPQVQAFLRDALESVFSRVQDLAGVFLITGSEDLTHCWSKVDTRHERISPDCPRCRERQPADLVIELLEIWSDVRRRLGQRFRIMAWNWSWYYWGEEAPLEIVRRLPAGIELLLDMEFGGKRRWKDREIEIGEYSLGYVGPCRQFLLSQNALDDPGQPIHAKIELNVTHELCSVPNLPVLRTLHAKFRAMVEHNVAGFLGCWSMGSQFTLNTYALKLFLREPERFLDEHVFLDALAREYLGFQYTANAIRAWTLFSEALTFYPFSVRILYNGPHNDAPARPLSLHYQGKPLGPSHRKNEGFGDDLHSCIEGFTLDEVCEGFTDLSRTWDDGLREYDAAFAANAQVTPSAAQEKQRGEEWGCAHMLGLQFHSIGNTFHFFREQQRVMQHEGLAAPCHLPCDPALLAIMEEEVKNAEQALPLVEADERLGFHQDTRGYKYNAATIRDKITQMRAEMLRTEGAYVLH